MDLLAFFGVAVARAVIRWSPILDVLLVLLPALWAGSMSRAGLHAVDGAGLAAMVLPAADALERWREYLLLDRECATSTVRTYRKNVRAFWGELGRPWQEATRRDLERWRAGTVTGKQPRAGQQRARTTAATYTTAVRGFYRWAAAEGLINADPMAGVRQTKVDDGPPRAITDRDLVAKILHGAGADPDRRMPVMVWLAYGAGMRCGEIAGARIEHLVLDDDAPRLEVVRKGGRRRVVYLRPAAVPALRSWLESSGRRHGPLVPSLREKSKPLKAATVSILLNRFLKRLEVEATAHALRHTFATELLRHTGNFYTVNRALDHKSLATTMRYVRGWDGGLVDALAALDAATFTFPFPAAVEVA